MELGWSYNATKVVLCNRKHSSRTMHSGTQRVEELNKTKQVDTHV